MYTMKKNIYKKGFGSIAALLIGALILGSAAFGFKQTQVNKSQITAQQEEIGRLATDLNVQAERLGGFRPSNYVGKLLTRLNEGGSETTFQTTPGTAKDGSTLTTAKIGDFVVFTVNPGAANEEKISASAVSVSGTTATWTIINRGLSFTENVAVTANKKQHAIGETVIISNDDHYMKAQYAAIDEDVTITGDWKVPTPANSTSIANRNYVDGLAFGGIGAASETATGTVELATQIEAASSTQSGTLGRLVLGANLATSTYNTATAPLRLVMTQNNGKIDNNFISTSTIFSGGVTLATTTATTTNIGSFPAYHIGKNIKVITTLGTSTFPIPAGVNKIYVRLVAAGGGGSQGATTNYGGPGAGGGYAEEMVNVTGTTSVQVFVGTGGTGSSSGGADENTDGEWTTFGTNGFFLSASGGLKGVDSSTVSAGVGSGGDINLAGDPGTFLSTSFSSPGGRSFFGYTYGGGGTPGTDNATNAAAGTQGLIIITW